MRTANEITISGIVLQPSNFPRLVQRHLDNEPRTRGIEEQAKVLVAANFPEDELKAFIRQVCEWGNRQGIPSRVFNQNDPSEIRERFINAINALGSDEPNIQAAFCEITQIRQLGPSFGSKHLRFLRPEVCPALDDKFISRQLGYALNASGYKRFSDDCLEIAEILQQRGISNPFRENGKWLAADVEMALYAHLKWP